MASSEISQGLQAYKTFDPAGWVDFYRLLPVYAGLAFIVVGAFFLALGSTRAARVISAPLGAALGYWAIPPLWYLLQIPAPKGQLVWLPVLVLALIGLASPAVFALLAVGLPVGLMAADWAGSSDALIGLAAGTIVGGLFGVIFWRQLLAILSALLGAWMLVLGLLSALHAIAPFLGELAKRMPLGVVGAAAVLALFGAAYQLSRRRTPETPKQKLERELAERQRREKEAIEKKWATRNKSP